MNETKPIRKHSGFRRNYLMMKYHLQKCAGLFAPSALIIAGYAMIAAICFLLVVKLPEFIKNKTPFSASNDSILFFVLFMSAGCLIVGFIYCATDSASKKLARVPHGHFLNPERPNEDEILPEAEVLVRASIATDAAQKETLLRPAAATDATDPQTLLRAANKTD